MMEGERGGQRATDVAANTRNKAMKKGEGVRGYSAHTKKFPSLHQSGTRPLPSLISLDIHPLSSLWRGRKERRDSPPFLQSTLAREFGWGERYVDHTSYSISPPFFWRLCKGERKAFSFSWPPQSCRSSFLLSPLSRKKWVFLRGGELPFFALLFPY